MSYIQIHNKSNEDVSFLKTVEKKLKPFLSLVSKEEYPISVIVLKKRDKNDLSSLDLESNNITLKYNSQLQSKEDIIFVFVHEIFHWISLKNNELKKIAFSDEIKYLENALKKVYPNNDSHDLMPYEVVANFMSALITGKFYKRHFFNKQKIEENNIKKIQIKQSNLKELIRKEAKKVLNESKLNETRDPSLLAEDLDRIANMLIKGGFTKRGYQSIARQIKEIAIEIKKL